MTLVQWIYENKNGALEALLVQESLEQVEVVNKGLELKKIGGCVELPGLVYPVCFSEMVGHSDKVLPKEKFAQQTSWQMKIFLTHEDGRSLCEESSVVSSFYQVAIFTEFLGLLDEGMPMLDFGCRWVEPQQKHGVFTFELVSLASCSLDAKRQQLLLQAYMTNLAISRGLLLKDFAVERIMH